MQSSDHGLLVRTSDAQHPGPDLQAAGDDHVVGLVLRDRSDRRERTEPIEVQRLHHHAPAVAQEAPVKRAQEAVHHHLRAPARGPGRLEQPGVAQLQAIQVLRVQKPLDEVRRRRREWPPPGAELRARRGLGDGARGAEQAQAHEVQDPSVAQRLGHLAVVAGHEREQVAGVHERCTTSIARALGEDGQEDIDEAAFRADALRRQRLPQQVAVLLALPQQVQERREHRRRRRALGLGQWSLRRLRRRQPGARRHLAGEGAQATNECSSGACWHLRRVLVQAARQVGRSPAELVQVARPCDRLDREARRLRHIGRGARHRRLPD
mmetsp:Transcript_93441/g.241538  ORF Transcript_93441/g.241538 Transcript_93441/m.241538 type:complete len:323 (+) Transcript_93441:189-1157(+)